MTSSKKKPMTDKNSSSSTGSGPGENFDNRDATASRSKGDGAQWSSEDANKRPSDAPKTDRGMVSPIEDWDDEDDEQINQDHSGISEIDDDEQFRY